MICKQGNDNECKPKINRLERRSHINHSRDGMVHVVDEYYNNQQGKMKGDANE
jgi:hypothetical protein